MFNNISFIIPAFNCAGTIEETVASIYSGNFEIGDEVIIVDDASTDNTYLVLLELQNKFPSINLYSHKHNKGSAAAGRNTAIDNAKNELLFCLDADNVLAEGSIIKLKSFMITNKADTVAFQEVHFFTKNKNEITHKRIYPKGHIRLSDALASDIWPGPSGNYMLTKSNWIKSGRYHEFVGGGIDSWAFGIWQLIAKSKMMVMPNSYYFHRYGHDSSYVRSEKEKNISLQALEILLPILRWTVPESFRVH